MNKWLARLSTSFLILAGFLIYQGYKELTGPFPVVKWRIGLYFVAAGISIGLAIRGVQERHRGDGE
jgi:hypothetical protein